MKKFLTYFTLSMLLPMAAWAQLTDDFSDGNFTNNPSWAGDATRFQVNAQELQLNDVNYDSPVSSLYLSAPTQGATTWEFYVRMEFNPSSSNYTRVYLASDQPDFTGSLNGYFVLLGSTADKVELSRQTGTSSTPIISSLDDVIDVTTPTVRVKVTRDAAGNWELLADYTGGTNFVSQGTGTDATHPTGTFYGVRCNYTSTRKDKFFFDDFFVDPIFVDNTAPTMMAALANSATEISVTFDEPIAAGSVVPGNFTLSGGLSIASVMLDPNDPNSVIITLSSPMTDMATYTVGSTVSDLAGNMASGVVTQNFQYIMPFMASPYDLIITEIMADPTPIIGLPDAEYVEIYNRSGNAIDLENYQFSSGTTPQLLPQYLLLPGEYVVVCDDSDVAAFQALGITNIVAVTTMPGLTNGGDVVTIADDNGNIIHEITYDDAWYQIATDGGISLEMINPDDLCVTPSLNWMASSDASGGTPGSQNSIFDNSSTSTLQVESATVLSDGTIQLTYIGLADAADMATASNYSINNGIGTAASVSVISPNVVVVTPPSSLATNTQYTITVTGVNDCTGLNSIDPNANSATFYVTEAAALFDLVINEFMADPSPIVSLPEAEYIEIFNRSNKVINLENYQISSGNTPQLLPTYIMLPGDYVVICDDSKLTDFQNSGIPNVIDVLGFNGLGNTGDDILLADDMGNPIHSITYDDAWYQDPDKDDGGWSLELINPDNFCSNPIDNWIASNDVTGGTPGAQNSVFDNSTGFILQVVSAFVLPDGNVQLAYNGLPDVGDASTASNYSINNGIGTPSSVVMLNSNTVVIIPASPLSTNTEYTITVNGVNDCTGTNSIDPNANTAMFYVTEPALAYDLIITEIMADPSPVVSLPELEYVEIHNRSGKVVNLEDYQVSSGGTPQLMPTYILLPGAYVLVCDDSSVMAFQSIGIGNVIGVGSFPGLSNSGDMVTLADQNGIIIHEVIYDDAWYQDPVKDDGGWSLEMINPDNFCANPLDNWIASADVAGGTPGMENSVYDNTTSSVLQVEEAFVLPDGTVQVVFSGLIDGTTGTNPANYTINNGIGAASSVSMLSANTVILTLGTPLSTNTEYTVTVTGVDDCSGLNSIDPVVNFASFYRTEPAAPFDIMITEIMIDENPPVVLPEAEYLELYNRSNKVINILNHQISANGGSAQILPRYILLPGEYVVVCDDSKIGDFQNLAINNVVAVTSFPSLTNDSGEILFANEAGDFIHNLNYSKEWYQDPDKDDGGYSLEMINPENPCDISGGNWRVTNSSTGGTPGLENSIFDTSGGEPPLQVVSAEIISTTQILITFSSSLDVVTGQDPTNYTIDNGIGNPITAAVTGGNKVLLDFANPLMGNVVYTVTATGLNNCTGAVNIDTNNNTAPFSLPEPEVLAAVIIESTQAVQVTFDVPMDPSTAVDPNNYFIEGLGNPTSVNVLSSLVVELIFGGSFENGTTYGLEISNVENTDGTAIIPVTVPIVYYIPVAINRYDIIINEFMANPNGVQGLPEVEYIELFNRSDKVISLEGFVLRSGTSNTSVFPMVVLKKGEYLIVYKEEEGVNFDPLGNNIALSSYMGQGLTNSGDDVALVAPNDDIIDALEFDLTWYQDPSKDDGGWSLERISPSSPCEGGSNWRATNNDLGGTPGKENSIFEDLLDENMPGLTRVFPSSELAVIVSFTESLSFTLASDPANYAIDGGINVVGANPIPPFYNQVELVLDSNTPLAASQLYTLAINSGLTDCVGNLFGMVNTAEFALPEAIEPGDVIINEVLFNPQVDGTDFIELYNNSNKIVNIGELVMYNDVASSTPSQAIEHDYLLFPQTYVVLTANPGDILLRYHVENEAVLLKNKLPSLNADYGNVTLVAIGEVIDKFDYKEDYHFELLDDPKGVSLERIDFDIFTNTPDNWHSASSNAGFATPTYVNSQYLPQGGGGSDIFTLTDDTFSPDNDGFEDFLRIDYELESSDYFANINVFDAKGRKVKDLVQNETLGTKGFIQWDGVNNDGEKARIGIYVLWIELFKPNGDKEYFKKTCVLAGQF